MSNNFCTINSKEIIQKLKNLSTKFTDVSPFLKLARVKLLAAIDKNFETEGKSSGDKWAEWSETYKKLRIKYNKGSNILQFDSLLRDSFTSVLEKNRLTIGTNKAYAAVHNFGFDDRNIPQREFMRFSDETYDELLEDINYEAAKRLSQI